jgi:hypothetical protein
MLAEQQQGRGLLTAPRVWFIQNGCGEETFNLPTCNLQPNEEIAKMDIGSVLSRAWQTIWRHKVLWIFGILAGCSGAGGNAGNIQTSWQEEAPPELQQYFDRFSQAQDWQIALFVGILLLIILVFVVLAIFFGTVGRIGLIQGAAQVERGATRLTFGELFSQSTPYFWRVFGLSLLVGIVTFFLVILLLLVVVLGSVVTLGIGAICLVPLLCLAVPVGWLVSVIVEQANVAIVLENRGIIAGLQRGWEVVRNNLGPIIIMGLILVLGVALIGGFIVALPLALVITPAILGALSEAPQAAGSGWLITGLCFVAYLPVLLVLNGILSSYIGTAWTYTFIDLTRRGTQVQPVPG